MTSSNAGEDEDWALHTLLREEKFSVQQLEQRNRALREHVNQLEAMI